MSDCYSTTYILLTNTDRPSGRLKSGWQKSEAVKYNTLHLPTMVGRLNLTVQRITNSLAA